MKARARNACYWMSDRLCWLGIHGEPTAGGTMFEMHPRRGRYRLTFWAGNLLGELGWRLR